MSETQEDRIHREYNERVAEISEKARDADWQDFARYADEIDALHKQLEVELAKLPKLKRRWFRR